jgi:hypothetical protein
MKGRQARVSRPVHPVRVGLFLGLRQNGNGLNKLWSKFLTHPQD